MSMEKALALAALAKAGQGGGETIQEKCLDITIEEDLSGTNYFDFTNVYKRLIITADLSAVESLPVGWRIGLMPRDRFHGTSYFTNVDGISQKYRVYIFDVGRMVSSYMCFDSNVQLYNYQSNTVRTGILNVSNITGHDNSACGGIGILGNIPIGTRIEVWGERA